MSQDDREDAIAVLQDLLLVEDFNGNAIKFVGRRLRDPNAIDPTQRPCIYLREYQDIWEDQNIDLPPVRGMIVLAFLYVVAATDNEIPNAILNGFIRAIELALTPDNGVTSLDGLARSCKLVSDGQQRYVDDKLGRGIAVLPIKIVFESP